MLLGKVVGTLVSTRKDEKLEGLKFLVVRNVDWDNQDAPGFVIAADGVGAGLDEVVIYARGSSARMTAATDNKPVDALIMGIVDTWEVDGRVRYRKDT